MNHFRTAKTGLIKAQPIGLNDAAAVHEVIASAFNADPVWSWAFPEPYPRNRCLEWLIRAASRFPHIYKTTHLEAVSVWIPPGENEFTERQEARIPGLLAELAGSRAADIEELLQRFETAHPRTEPHYYLSILACHPEHAGRGLGMALLKENLARIDAQCLPAYLESSNPVNNQKYESVGFKAISSFQTPGNGPTITCMWRDKIKA